MSTKPVVEYVNNARFLKRTLTEPEIIARYKKYLGKDNSYEIAGVYAMNHPRLGQGPVTTSIVIKKNSDGSFETLNTIYKPVIEEDHI